MAVLAACCGVVIFWETTEREQRKTLALTKQLADAEITRRRFTSDLLVNLARRNQSLLYRQLGLINQLEDQEQDPDALADLFQLDHLATRIRRNAESLLVLSGEEPPRTWGRPVPLVDVVRAAIAETEDLDRVVFAVDERLAVFGNAVADLTHLMAELVENAVHFSPPEASVILRTRPYLQAPGAHVLTVEDWGVGMRAADMAAANEVLAAPQEVDLSVSQRLGLHVVARLAQRHGIEVSLTPTPGCGVTAAVVLPASLFSDPDAAPDELFAGEAEVPAGVVPAALAAAVTPAADLPPPRPRPPRRAGRRPSAGSTSPRSRPATATADRRRRAPRQRRPAAGGNGADQPAGDEADWSGWWEPSPGDLEGAGAGVPARRPAAAVRARPGRGPAGPTRSGTPPTGCRLGPPNGRVADSREGAAAVHSPQTRDPPRPAPVRPGRRSGGAAAVAAGAAGPPGARAAAPRAGGQRPGPTAPCPTPPRPGPPSPATRPAARRRPGRWSTTAEPTTAGAARPAPRRPPTGGWS